MYYLGVDFGSQRDYTALALVSREEVIIPKKEHYKIEEDRRDSIYRLHYLERMELGTPYTQIVEHLKVVTNAPEIKGQVTVIADATGVGLPVVQMMRQAGIGPLIPIGIHGGNAVNEKQDGYSVPKRDLVSALLIAFQGRRIKIPSDIMHRQELIHEMQAFKMKQRDSGSDSYEALMEKDHDDLVLALSYAIWYPEKTMGAGSVSLKPTRRDNYDLLSRRRSNEWRT